MPDSYADLLMSMRVLEERYGKAIQVGLCSLYALIWVVQCAVCDWE